MIRDLSKSIISKYYEWESVSLVNSIFLCEKSETNNVQQQNIINLILLGKIMAKSIMKSRIIYKSELINYCRMSFKGIYRQK